LWRTCRSRKIHKVKMSIGQYGYIALVVDGEGNMIAEIRPLSWPRG